MENMYRKWQEMKMEKAVEWWGNMGDHEQQVLANKYYPKDDFIKTHKDGNRIERIHAIETFAQNT